MVCKAAGPPPLLFFTCTGCPTGHMGDTTSHKDVFLVFFDTFDSISLTPESCMQRKGVPMLYERAASQVTSLYVCPVENVLGRVPLIPCYLNGNSVNTIPHCFRGKIPRKIQDPTTGLGAGCSKSTCGCGAMEGPFLVKSLWIKLWNSAKRGCRNPGLVALRLFGAGVMPPGQRELPLRSE